MDESGFQVIENKKTLFDDHVGCSILIGVFIFLGILIFAWMIINPINPEELITVKHEEFNFSLEHPANWIPTSFGESGSHGDYKTRLSLHLPFSFIPEKSPTFYIFVESKAIDNPNLQDVIDWSDENLENLSSGIWYEDIFLREEELNDQLIMRRQYSYDTMKYEEVLIPRPNDMIIITLQVSEDYFHEYRDEFDRLVESFRPLE